MQAQIETGQAWQARLKNRAVALALVATATLMLVGVGFYALMSASTLQVASSGAPVVTRVQPADQPDRDGTYVPTPSPLLP